MASKAMTQSSDSLNLAAPLKCSPNERPPVKFTAAGLLEMRQSTPTLAIPVPFEDGKYTCPYCNGECTRSYCAWCYSDLLDQDE